MQMSKSQRLFNKNDTAMVESIKQEVLAELHTPHYPQVNGLVNSNRAFTERIKREVLQQIRRNEMMGQNQMCDNYYTWSQSVEQESPDRKPRLMRQSQSYSGVDYDSPSYNPGYYPDPHLVQSIAQAVLRQIQTQPQTMDE